LVSYQTILPICLKPNDNNAFRYTFIPNPLEFTHQGSTVPPLHFGLNKSL